MDLQPAERISEDEGQHPEILGDGVDPNADAGNVDSPSHAQSSPPPGLPNLSRCAACYNHKKNFLYGGDGESSSSAGDSGPEVDWDSEPESLSSSSSSSSSSSVEEDEQEKRSSPAASEGGGKDEEREDGGQEPEGAAEGTLQTQSQDAPASSILQSRPTSRPRTVVSTLHLRVLPQEHAGDAVCIIQLHEEKTEERDGEPGIYHLPPQTGWSHAPSQQHQLSYPQQQHLQAYQMFPQHLPPFLSQGQRSPLTLHSPYVRHRPAQHVWPQPPYAAQTHLGPQVPQQCWCCYNRVLPPFGYQNQNSNVIMEPSSPKKIQFAVPPLQAQLDPQAAEHIRRRRPTPATLQIYRQPGTDVGEQHAGEDTQPSDASQRNQSSYTQPSMKEIQQGVEQQLLGAGVCEADSQQSPITAQLYATSSLWANHNGPEEPNGNEASLMLANQERGVEASNSSGETTSLTQGKLAGSVPEEEEEEPNQSD